MALFKCKMCGGDLEIAEGITIAECEYCGTKQTVPKVMDENLNNLFNRANTLRIKSEFDKAEKLYEKIIQADSTQSEAYWGLILCKYGIEYVDDPATYKKVPTCHRASYDSIIADDDYKSAIANADLSQRAIYEAQAKEIDRIQKDILALAQKEENYDVFICYKETDADGKRTQDSVIANDIYYQLKQEGFKVFYAAITLEGKLGSAYEPIIFAALNSAKVMLTIGTRPEYFNAVWVKNEWSRYLKIIKKDRTKLLIPCYRDMDAYELPEEFAHLQAQDMSKIGFINDVVRGIKKVIKKDEPKTTVVKETVVTGASTNTAPLLKRAFMFLEDGEWDSADEYCEKVLDVDPENVQAYLGKLMAELHVKKQEQLKDCEKPFDKNNNYQKVLRFADDSLKTTLTGYVEHIITRNENARLEAIYNKARTEKASANNESSYREAAKLFETISGYKDADAQRRVCIEKADESNKNAIYGKAMVAMQKSTPAEVTKAINWLKFIKDWRDSEQKIAQCESLLAKLIKEEEAERIRMAEEAEAKRIQREKEAEARRIESERKAKRNKKIAIIATPIVCSVIVFVIILTTVIIPSNKYGIGEDFIEAGDYIAAMEVFKNLNYKDSYDRYCEAFILLKESYEQKAEECLTNGDKINAAIYYIKAGQSVKAKEVYDFGSRLQVSEYTTAAILNDGTFKISSNYEYNYKNDLKKYNNTKNIVKLFSSIRYGFNNIIGIDKSGNLESFGEQYTGLQNNYSNIKQIIGQYDFTCYLTEDGKVFCEYRKDVLYPNVSSWSNIKEIYYHDNNIFGLDYNGNVHTTNESKYKVSSWKNVAKLGFKYDIVFGVTSENKIIYSCYDTDNYTPKFNSTILGYTDVVDAIYVSPYLVVLHSNGTVSMEYVDNDKYTEEDKKAYELQIAEEVKTWDGIVCVQECAGGIIGIKVDGTVKYVSTDIYAYDSSSGWKDLYDTNDDVKAEIESWTDIVWVTGSVKEGRYGDDGFVGEYAVGIKINGSMVATGDGDYTTTEENAYGGGYHDQSHSGGTYHLVGGWKLWE